MKAFLFIALLFSGLIAGLLFGYSCSVNPGLTALPDAEYISAMQSINIAIQNPVFLTVFVGLALIFPVTVFVYYKERPKLYYLLVSAAIVYMAGVFGVTLFFNVPLNRQLAGFSGVDRAGIRAIRQAFEGPWNAFHSIRTAAAIVAFGLTGAFALRQK